MSKARLFTPPNRLADVLQTGRGAPAHEHIANAEKRVADIAPSIRTYVFERAQRILALANERDAASLQLDPTLGATAQEMSEVAGAADLQGMGEVARGISAIVNWAATASQPRPEALALHLDALRLLEAGEGHAEGEDQMLERLHALRTALGVPE